MHCGAVTTFERRENSSSKQIEGGRTSARATFGLPRGTLETRRYRRGYM